MGPKTIQLMSKTHRLSAQSYQIFFRLDKWNHSKARRKHNASFWSYSFAHFSQQPCQQATCLDCHKARMGSTWTCPYCYLFSLQLSVLNRYYEKLNRFPQFFLPEARVLINTNGNTILVIYYGLHIIHTNLKFHYI